MGVYPTSTWVSAGKSQRVWEAFFYETGEENQSSTEQDNTKMLNHKVFHSHTHSRRPQGPRYLSRKESRFFKEVITLKFRA